MADSDVIDLTVLDTDSSNSDVAENMDIATVKVERASDCESETEY